MNEKAFSNALNLVRVTSKIAFGTLLKILIPTSRNEDNTLCNPKEGSTSL